MTDLEYSQWLQVKRDRDGDRFVPPPGADVLAKYCHEDVRVEIEDRGYITRGFVGITTGWAPAFILLRTRRSKSSWVILGADTKVLKVLKY
jgi:hypothetical protein